MLMQREPTHSSPVKSFAAIVRKIAVESARRPRLPAQRHATTAARVRS
jgi:hypothetical protein